MARERDKEGKPVGNKSDADLKEWFENCGGWRPRLDLDELRRGIASGFLNEQDESGMTALSLSVMSKWEEGVEELLRAGAETELRYFRTGESTLLMAVQNSTEPIILALVSAGADPDAPNHFGLTPRFWVSRGTKTYFDHVPQKETSLPTPLIQNAEQLADHYYPSFQIPTRKERETRKVGQAVDLYVYGPKSETKQDKVKVRITAISGKRPNLRYTATIETPIENTNLPADTTIVEFGPEHIATVYTPPPKSRKKKS